MPTELLAPSAPGTLEAQSLRCTHCGLNVPAGLVDPKETDQFCCSGCRTAYAIIHENGLEDFYGIRDQCDVDTAAACSAGTDVEIFDDPTFTERHVTFDAVGRCRVRLGLAGLHCAACVWLVEKLPRLAPGVIDARVDLIRSHVTLVWDNTATPLSEIAAVLIRLGYSPHPLDESGADARDADNRRQLLRLAVAGACAGNAMLIAFALYAGMFSAMNVEHARLFRAAGTAVGLIAILWPGAVFFRGAWAALRTRTPHMDVPVAIGLGVGGIAGVVNTISDRGETYFDTLALLVFLLLVGRYLMFRGQQRALDRVSLLQSLTPRIAYRVTDEGDLRTVPADSLQCGDVVEVRAGELIPADGQIIEGESAIDESLLTGESAGRSVGGGDHVTAGATNLSAKLCLHVTAVGAQSRIGRVMGLVEDASGRKPPIVLFADRISGWFVTVVLVLAVITVTLWWQTSSELAIDHAVALLIVACPCALGLATPLTIAVAQGRAARRGILIKSGGIAEYLARPGQIWLDKTGTLTEGRMTLRRWIGSEEIKPLVLALEMHVAHPIADALVRSLKSATDRACRVTYVRQVTGGGVTGRVDGQPIVIGSERFIRENGMTVEAELCSLTSSWLEAGDTPIFVAVGGRVVAAAAVGDSVRPDALAAVAELKRLGWKVGILSGDHSTVVATVARKVGIAVEEAFGGLSPEDKLTKVEESRKYETTLMAGDGVNDSAALAAASVGVAVHGGAEVSLRAADVYITRPGLTPLVELVRGGRRAVRIIRSNFAASLGYNSIAVVLAIAGLVNPLVAAILMPISSLTVLAFALGGRSFVATAAAKIDLTKTQA